MRDFDTSSDFSNPERYQMNVSFEQRYQSDAPRVDSILGVASTIEMESKDYAVRNAFMSILPHGIELQNALRKGNLLWMFLNKTHGNDKRTFSSFESFAMYAVAEGTIYDIARIAHILAYSSAVDMDRVTMAVDLLILSNDKYISSLDGLRCLILQGLLFNESGQLKKAWKTYRKGIKHAQLMSLHTTRQSLEEDRVWWALYTLDRNASLLLGKPYAISDKHCTLTFQGKRIDEESPQTFVGFHFRLSQITGRCIDHLHNSCPNSPEIGLTELDHELAQFSSLLPDEFWKTDPMAPKDDAAKSFVWRYRVVNQLVYHQIFLALYLTDFLKTESHDAKYDYIRGRCIHAARKYLQLFHQLRHPSNRSMLKSRAFDSTACAAAMALILGIWDSEEHENNTLEQRNDWAMVQASMQLYKSYYSSEQDEKAAYHSYNVLQQFNQTRNLRAIIEMNVDANYTIPLFQDVLLTRASNTIIKFSTPQSPPQPNDSLQSTFNPVGIQNIPPGLSPIETSHYYTQHDNATRICETDYYTINNFYSSDAY
jgi:hypothetical protein